MKTRRILSLCLAMFLCLSLIPAVSLVSYAEQAPTTLPTTQPDGSSVDGSKLWVDWSDAGSADTKGGTITEDGYFKVASGNYNVYTQKDAHTTSWRGASGIMFYVDASEATGVDFILTFLMVGARSNSATSSGCVQLQTAPTIYAGVPKGIEGTKSTAYTYKDGAWADFSVSYPNYYLKNSNANSGWYYVPLTSFHYHGGSANGYAYTANDPCLGMNFEEFTARFQDQRIWKIGIKSNYVGLKFSDIHFVYTNPEAAPAGATAPLFGTMAQNSKEGSAAGTIENNTLTVNAMPNSTTVSNNKIWLKGMSNADQATASGIRFHVDTSALGDARLQMRLRLMYANSASTIGKNQDRESGIFATGGMGYAAPAGGWCQYVCRADNSVAYYYDADGNPVALHVASDVSTAPESDLFDALPAGYKGDIYIPMDSFWLSAGSYNANGGMALFLPYSEAGGVYPFSLLGVCHAVSGETTDNTVVYSNFELVYPETYISGASVTLKNNLDVNFFANLGNATDAKMTFAVGTKIETVDGTVLADGRTKFVCSGILPQKVNDEITATLTAKVNGTAVSQTMTYSVREYCENLLAKEDTSETVKKLLVDLLYYAEAAQNYANYKIDDLATKNLTDAQKALRSADTTGAITATTGLDGTADGQYKWVSAALRLENTVAIRIKFAAPSLEGLTVKVTLNGRTVTYTADNITDEGEGYYSILFNNIGAGEYGDAVTAIMEKDGAQIAETLTYSVAAYIREAVNKESTTEKTLALVRALWSYGESAKAVSAS